VPGCVVHGSCFPQRHGLMAADARHKPTERGRIHPSGSCFDGWMDIAQPLPKLDTYGVRSITCFNTLVPQVTEENSREFPYSKTSNKAPFNSNPQRL
jgi:hypothetical protein